jgi:hypothetical protein
MNESVFPIFIVGQPPEKDSLWVLHTDYPQGLIAFDNKDDPEAKGVELHFLCDPEGVSSEEVTALIDGAVRAAKKWLGK